MYENMEPVARKKYLIMDAAIRKNCTCVACVDKITAL